MTYQLLILLASLWIFFSLKEVGTLDLKATKIFLDHRYDILIGSASGLAQICKQNTQPEFRKNEFPKWHCKLSISNRHGEPLCELMNSEHKNVKSLQVFLNVECRYSNRRLGVNNMIIKRLRSQVRKGAGDDMSSSI